MPSHQAVALNTRGGWKGIVAPWRTVPSDDAAYAEWLEERARLFAGLAD